VSFFRAGRVGGNRGVTGGVAQPAWSRLAESARELSVDHPGQVVGQRFGLPNDEQDMPEGHLPGPERRVQQRPAHGQHPRQAQAGPGGELRDVQGGRDLRGGPRVGVLPEDRGDRRGDGGPVPVGVTGRALVARVGGGEWFGGRPAGVGHGVGVGVADRDQHRQGHRGQPRRGAFPPDQQPDPVCVAQRGRVDPGELGHRLRARVLDYPAGQHRPHTTPEGRVERRGPQRKVSIEHTFWSIPPDRQKAIVHKAKLRSSPFDDAATSRMPSTT
jgi:hypothetical protein